LSRARGLADILLTHARPRRRAIKQKLTGDIVKESLGDGGRVGRGEGGGGIGERGVWGEEV
jgi:hypothetical protein